ARRAHPRSHVPLRRAERGREPGRGGRRGVRRPRALPSRAALEGRRELHDERRRDPRDPDAHRAHARRAHAAVRRGGVAMRTWASLVVGVLLAALLVYVVISNNDIVIVTLPLVKWPTKLWGAMVASAIAGAGATLLLTSWPLVRLKLQSRRHTR